MFICVERQNTPTRTNGYALAAGYAFVIVDNRKVVGKFYRARGAVFLAESACDTADGTDLGDVLAAVGIGTCDIDFRLDGDTPYYLFRTDGDASSAACAFLIVDLGACRVLIYFDCRIFTRVGASSESHTARITRLVSACEHLRGFAVAVTLIGVFVAAAVAAYAMNDGDGADAFFLAHAEHAAYVFAPFAACGIALRQFGFAFEQGFGKRAATRIAAAAAVCARKVALYFVDTSVTVYCEFLSQKTESESNERAEYERNYYGEYECHEYFHCRLPLKKARNSKNRRTPLRVCLLL